MIVDDDEGHTILIRQSFAEVGLPNQFVEFCDGQAVLNFLQGITDRVAGTEFKHPFLLLLDIRMPKVDGIEVLRRIRAEAGLHNMPVIMLTTSDDPREVARCYALGCNAYIQKPMDCGLFAEATRLVGQYTQLLLLPEIGCA